MATGKLNTTPSNKTPKTASAKPEISNPAPISPKQQEAIDRLTSEDIPKIPMRDMTPAQRKLIQDLVGDGEKGQGINYFMLDTECRKIVARDVLHEISSAMLDDCPKSQKDCPHEDDSFIGNHFAWGASQINTDLAIAAQCEFEEDVYPEDENFFDLYRSSEYVRLRRTFLEDAEGGHSDALLKIVWRAYNAGLVSPNRLIPDSREVRQERRLRQDKADALRKAGKTRTGAEKALADATELAREPGYKGPAE